MAASISEVRFSEKLTRLTGAKVGQPILAAAGFQPALGILGITSAHFLSPDRTGPYHLI